MQQAKENPMINQQDQCSICFVLCTKPVKCKGPCHKLFCFTCALQAKWNDDRCPNRCSKPFEVLHMPAVLRCPYQLQNCIVAINSEQEMESHHLVCPFVSQQEKDRLLLKDGYKCSKGHKLTFLPKEALVILYGKYWFNDARMQCAQCKEWHLCRSICLVCSIKEKQDVYCHVCRPPPCTQTKCPMGHKLKERKKPGKCRFCDLCDTPVGFVSNRVRGFCPCDFDLCEICFSKQPQTNEKIPLRWNPKQIYPLSLVNDDDSDDSDWQQ